MSGEKAGDPPRTPRRRLLRGERGLIVLFLCTLPLTNPWVHGDGVGYYSFARSLLIEHHLDFERDWLRADPEFRLAHTDAQGRIRADNFTATGAISNHFSIGPAMLWFPFLLVVHAGVLISHALGAHVLADGYSRPYIVTMAVATAFYGFLALWISFQIARRYLAERWAFLATVGIWAASSLPVYMYFNPSWSHAQSAFVVALFLWYWDRTRGSRTLVQWVTLGLIAGLMMDVYYTNGIVMFFPLFESVDRYRRILFQQPRQVAPLLTGNVLFGCAAFLALLPTLITKKIIFGSYFDFGYGGVWSWNSPYFLKAGFSAEHGLFSWTPIIVLAVIGLFFFIKRARDVAIPSLATFSIYFYVIGCYGAWHGIASFGNRFFISLTPVFVLGLAALFDRLERAWNIRRAAVVATAGTAVLIIWNLGMIYQWGMHLIPVRGPISWRVAAYNQVAVVPEQAARTIERYLMRRGQLLQHVEQEDVKQLRATPSH